MGIFPLLESILRLKEELKLDLKNKNGRKLESEMIQFKKEIEENSDFEICIFRNTLKNKDLDKIFNNTIEENEINYLPISLSKSRNFNNKGKVIMILNCLKLKEKKQSRKTIE